MNTFHPYPKPTLESALEEKRRLEKTDLYINLVEQYSPTTPEQYSSIIQEVNNTAPRVVTYYSHYNKKLQTKRSHYRPKTQRHTPAQLEQLGIRPIQIG